MEAVVKVGGSLTEHPEKLKVLCEVLSSLGKAYRMLIVPGGGAFADVVRKLDETYRLSETTAHKMAILAMDQFGLLLSDITPNSFTCHSLEDVTNTKCGLLPILLPSHYMFRVDPLEHSWNVTSDSIAAYIASVVGAERLVLITDVDGIYTDDPKRNVEARLIGEIKAEQLLILGMRTSVDKALPKLLMKFKMDCYVVNGMYPERVQAIFAGEKSVYTHIIPF